jgi:hypothetical protein
MRTFKASFTLLRAATLLIASIPALAWADPICAYVLGNVGGQVVATPALVVFVPDSSAEVQPVRVHVDPIDETILGYSVRGPGADYETDKKTVFVEGVNQPIDPIVVSVPLLSIETYRCIDVDQSTPAIPVFVPGSVLTTPGAMIETPAINLNVAGQPVTAPGKVIQLPGKTIVIPDHQLTVPSIPIQTPPMTIEVEIDGTRYPADYLPAR